VPFQKDFSPSNDYAFMLANIAPSILEHPNCSLRADVSVDNVTAVFAELDQFVGMRFHSLVLAATTGTPFVGISYDIKCETFLAESAYDHWIALEDVDAGRLLDALDRLDAGPSDGTRPLEAAVSPLFAQARSDLAAALPETALR
jgi:polysaccharide pyruvyl transferase WcaK-like protein